MPKTILQSRQSIIQAVQGLKHRTCHNTPVGMRSLTNIKIEGKCVGCECQSSPYRAHEVPSGTLNGTRYSSLNKSTLNTDQRIIQLALKQMSVFCHMKRLLHPNDGAY